MKIIRKRIADMERATYNPRVELQPGDAEYETLKRSLVGYYTSAEVLPRKLPHPVQSEIRR